MNYLLKNNKLISSFFYSRIYFSINGTSYYCENANFDNSSVHWIFRINYMYYSLIGTLLVAVCGYIISIITSDGTDDFDEKLLSPLFRRSDKPQIEKLPVEMTFIDYGDEIEKLKDGYKVIE